MPKPRKKKYPRLPNAYGSIRYLGGNRTNPYAVHPPAKLADDLGDYERPKAICYVDDWYVGFAVLNAYHAGTYQPGDELKFKQYKPLNERELDSFCRRLLADHSAHSFAENIRNTKEKTFSEVYDLFFEWKYGENAAKKLSKQSRDSTKAAFKRCEAIHQKAFVDLRHDDLQTLINNCPTKSATKENIVSLFKQMYRYAKLYGIAEKDYSEGLQIANSGDDEHGIPFTESELKTFWANTDNPVVEMILIMCYSGYRIAAYKNISVNLKEQYFQGGVKTAAGKDRIVPIHPAILPLVSARIKRSGVMLKESPQAFRKSMYEALNDLGIDKHTPHDCRHTFSMLCEKYKVPEADRKRMLGHSFGNDITNGIYGHRTLEELRESIELITV